MAGQTVRAAPLVKQSLHWGVGGVGAAMMLVPRVALEWGAVDLRLETER